MDGHMNAGVVMWMSVHMDENECWLGRYLGIGGTAQRQANRTARRHDGRAIDRKDGRPTGHQND